ncbi:MAG TPA: hypothetical protein ENJ18_12145 [Nannocystis exedens]|nr:hypothetical protein [Nannocystis exedens]
MAGPSKAHTAYPSEVYESFDAFMQSVLKDVYERGAKRAEFVALLLASGELMPMAWGRMRKSGVREFAMGAAGVVALRYAIAYLVSGPLGIALTGFTVATLISFFWSNQREVMARRKPYKQLISDTREKFEDIQARYQDGRYDSGERALLIEGLLRRMLGVIEAPIEGDDDDDEDDEA